MLSLDNTEDNWIFYAKHQCIPGFKIDKQTNYRTSTCEYDADYYDARWSSESPTCIGKFYHLLKWTLTYWVILDFNAVKDFKASVQATQINGDDAQSAIANNPSRDDSLSTIENAVSWIKKYSEPSIN